MNVLLGFEVRGKTAFLDMRAVVLWEYEERDQDIVYLPHGRLYIYYVTQPLT